MTFNQSINVNSSSASGSFSSGSYFNVSSFNGGGFGSGTYNYSITCSGRIIANNDICRASSKNKKDIIEGEDKCLQDLIPFFQNMKFYKYKLKDNIKDKRTFYGIIAEEVYELNNDLVYIEDESFIPNIYQYAKCV